MLVVCVTSFSLHFQLSSSANSSRPGTPAQDDAVSEEATLRQLTVLIADSRLMEKKAAELFEERIKHRLPGDADSQDGSASGALPSFLLGALAKPRN
jgi:hypothetical protein